MWNQRSVDTFLGLPFNIASYGLLLEIIAKEVNMVPDELIGEKRGYERIQTTNSTQIENLEARIEKNNGIILKIAEEFEREKIYKIYVEIYGTWCV